MGPSIRSITTGQFSFWNMVPQIETATLLSCRFAFAHFEISSDCDKAGESLENMASSKSATLQLEYYPSIQLPKDKHYLYNPQTGKSAYE